MKSLIATAVMACVCASFSASRVEAQQVTGAPQMAGPFVDAAIPFSYSRGRNVSVAERPHPDYAPLGVLAGGFILYPTFILQPGFTDNAYQSDTDKKSDGFVVLAPNVTASSNWARHSLKVDAGGRFVRYFSATERNEDGWHVQADGRLDVSSSINLNLGARTARQYESRFSGTSLDDVRSSNPYQATIGRGLAEFDFARSKLQIASDYTNFDFKSVQTFSGLTVDQTNRNRDIWRATGHYEYSISPDTGVFVEGGYVNTNYDTALAPGIANRDSKEYRIVGGVSFDITALVRGSIGVGYVRRNYDAVIYNDIGGVSFAGQVEYFPTDLTTVTFTGRRTIQDATTLGSSGYFATGGGARIDHELLRNLTLNIGGDFESDSYRGIDATVRIFRIGGGANYLISRTFALGGSVAYAKRDNSGVQVGPQLSETRGLISLTVQR